MIQTSALNRYVVLALAFGILLTLGILAGCTSSLGPNMSYQGRLTDASGNPLNGNYAFTFRLYNAETGGTSIYTETKTIAVANGLFDTSVGPTTLLANVTPEMLAQPLWLEVSVETETLSPRQRLLGSPYAFTLMPGAVISSTFNTTIPGPYANAIVKIVNNDTGANSHPALQLVGNIGIELVDISGSHGTIFSDRSSNSSDIYIRSNDYVNIYLDNDSNSGGGDFWVYGSPLTEYCHIDGSDGSFYCTGTKSSIADIGDEKRALYAVESPDVVFEDFGSGQLENGQASVRIDTLFAATINLDTYQVFITPLGDCNGLYVTNKTATGFEVRELGGGTADIAFDYRIVAKRLGYENVRMETVEPANGDGEEK
ncbi:MAG: hypothetical protein ACOYYS_20240 [Chloroflexota bacterium]